MSDVWREWVEIADRDWHTANRLQSVVDPEQAHPAAVRFHVQQCIEKLMKAILIHRRIVAPKTHNLAELNVSLRAAVPQWSWDVDELRWISHGAVVYRYPGVRTNVEEARRAVEIAARIRERLLSLLPDEALDAPPPEG